MKYFYSAIYFYISELTTEPRFLGIQYRKQEQWNPNWSTYQESQSRLQIAFPSVQLNTCGSGNLPNSKLHLQQTTEVYSLKVKMFKKKNNSDE